jgi:NADH-quinone oxidoreductase subunit K
MVYFVLFGLILFFFGMLGLFLTRRNLIVIIMCIELMLLGLNIDFIVYSFYLDDLAGEIFSLFILTVAAAESAIGLAILVVYYRIKGTIATLFINKLKG